MNSSPTNTIEIYQADDQTIEVRLDAQQDTVWLTQAQMSELFDVQPQNIAMHAKNIYKEQELIEDSTCKDFLQVQTDRNSKESRRGIWSQI